MILAALEGPCAVPAFMGPLSVVLGSLALLAGLRAWNVLLPERIAKFTRCIDTVVDQDNSMWRVLGPLNGSIFVLIGIWLAWSAVHCGQINLGVPNFRAPIAFSDWPGVYVGIIVFTVISIYNSREFETLWTRIAFVLCTACFGFAAGQAAGFHVGDLASQWGAIALIFGAISSIFAYLDGKAAQKQQ